MAKLKAAILAAQTLGELHALMEDYSYMEFMQIYNQLTPEQQAKLNVIDERDSKAQMLAINTGKAPVAEGNTNATTYRLRQRTTVSGKSSWSCHNRSKLSLLK
ncbi:MAG TPA: hypothetical protein DCE56_06215 [Cyanobacteria bacterium UBA8553]|nr:hypothetical protein [Cyanobacteria bacterium UBA8553]HAJ63814.1 hypothetical protein [Cyanobacteria bacterium UBA8543]